MALAIAYVWITEDLYDKAYVRERTVGFDKWRDYILGTHDGTPKTPQWQEPETTVPAKDVRALARMWGTRKTYLSPGGLAGFGGGLPLCHGHRVGSRHGVPDGHAGVGETGRQHGLSAAGRAFGYQFLLSGLCRRRTFRGSGTTPACG